MYPKLRSKVDVTKIEEVDAAFQAIAKEAPAPLRAVIAAAGSESLLSTCAAILKRHTLSTARMPSIGI